MLTARSTCSVNTTHPEMDLVFQALYWQLTRIARGSSPKSESVAPSVERHSLEYPDTGVGRKLNAGQVRTLGYLLYPVRQSPRLAPSYAQ